LQSTVKDALDYGRGPFDQSPATGSEAALEGLHESSWGNSGKWGARDPNPNGDAVTQDKGENGPSNGPSDPAESDPPTSDPPN